MFSQIYLIPGRWQSRVQVVSIFSLNIHLPFTAAGFGLRVVGGKTGADGRTFAYVMWTVPDGPAAKAGIQRGDKVRCHIFFVTLRYSFKLAKLNPSMISQDLLFTFQIKALF